MSQPLNSYDLSRAWFDFCFANPEQIKPNHTALYFFAIEHCNRLGWKLKFGLPSGMAMEAIGIKSYNTFSKTLSDLVEWGFMIMIEKSKNQYSSNIVALSKFDKALVKALDKAFIKHSTKQSESTIQSTVQSIDSIDKQITSKQIHKEQVYRGFKHLKLFQSEFEKLIEEGWTQSQIDTTLDKIENYKKNTNYTSLLFTARNWLKSDHKPNQVEQKLNALDIVKNSYPDEPASNTGTD